MVGQWYEYTILAYFKKIKIGLSNHQPLSVCLCVPH
jgi:hypothetical protein